MAAMEYKLEILVRPVTPVPPFIEIATNLPIPIPVMPSSRYTVPEKVTAVTNSQLVLLPEFVELPALMGEALMLLESFTSTNETLLDPCGSIFHWEPLMELLKMIKFPEVPDNVKVPVTVWVEAAVKVSGLLGVVEVKL